MLARIVAESTIVRLIIEGSGGPENAPINNTGLRFVRHLLSLPGLTSHGFFAQFQRHACNPNFGSRLYSYLRWAC